MTRLATLLVACALVGLALVQGTILSFLPTPAAVPDVVTVSVLALACGYGPVVGGLAGVWAGAVLDLVPPAAGPLGGWVLVLAGVAGALGRVASTRRPGPWGTLALLVVAAGATVLVRGAVLWFTGARVGPDLLVHALAAAGYALLLAPLALLVVVRGPARRTAPARTVPLEVAS